MPRFLFLLSPVTAPGPVAEWVTRQAAGGVVRSGGRVSTGTRLERADGVTTVADAPARWGFLVVEAEDARAALALAASCPGTDPGTVELYHVDAADVVGAAAADAASVR
jgi:hypothetical protein